MVPPQAPPDRRVSPIHATPTLGSHWSIAVTRPTFGPGTSPMHDTAMEPGQVMLGATVSWTVMSCTADDEFPQESVAVQVRVRSVTIGHTPCAVTSEYVTTGPGSQTSVAVACPVLDGSVPTKPHSIVMLGGTVRIGGVASVR